jgi:hypothetical protein
VVLNGQTHEIIATAFGKGRTHDFKLFTHSSTHIHPDTVVLADLGYLGLEKLHAYSFLPTNATKHHPLTPEEKRANRTLARLRLHIERVIGRLKVFRILADVTVAAVNASVCASTLSPPFTTSNSLSTRDFRKRSNTEF